DERYLTDDCAATSKRYALSRKGVPGARIALQDPSEQSKPHFSFFRIFCHFFLFAMFGRFAGEFGRNWTQVLGRSQPLSKILKHSAEYTRSRKFPEADLWPICRGSPWFNFRVARYSGDCQAFPAARFSGGESSFVNRAYKQVFGSVLCLCC